uniref:Pectate lyase n=1 Tax=Ananas comosus var. bracteatus TaxID=296719 RepID=A0A6V7QCW5_ANACO|nr:unnamed protein product [Ananas comosus var. bracteatus]
MGSSKLTLSLLLFLLLVLAGSCTGTRSMNVIDRCWRRNPNWAANRERLAVCSLGFAGKMRRNIGKGLTWYTVTNPGDDPVRPRPGTLRYGATVLPGKVWITFAHDMQIRLQQPLAVKSFTTIDGRGANVQIAYGAGFLLYQRRDHPRAPIPQHPIDGGGRDAIRLVGSRRVWLDHNTLYASQDGLVDVSRGSTAVTVSNNWFRDHDKVMLLGHDDGYLADRRMRVTVAFNRFGPNCNQRMPRIRHGYAHVVNNLYDGWGSYAIGGSMGPRVKSQANLFVASNSSNKKVTSRIAGNGEGESWNWRSVNDAFANGAFFRQSGHGRVRPGYNRQQQFPVGSARAVRALTRDAGALWCSTRTRC